MVWYIEILKNSDDFPETENKEKKYMEFINKLIEFQTGTTVIHDDMIDKNNLKGQNSMKVTLNNKSLTSLPISHSCFNDIELPRYKTKKNLYTKLIQAASYNEPGAFEGGKRKIKKRKIKKIKKVKKSKKIRRHKGINQKTGRLKKGFKYTGKKTKTGLPIISKIKLQIKRKKVKGKTLYFF